MRAPALRLLPALLCALVVAGCTTPAVDPPVDAPILPSPLVPVLSDITKVADNPNSQSEASITVSPDGQTLLTCFHGFFSSLSPGYASTDGGATWTRMQFPVQGGIGGDCETALLDDGSWAFLASTVAGATVLVSRDNGATWASNPLAAIPVNGLADRPWLVGVGNELWLAYMPLNSQPGTIGFTKSADHGATWSVPALIGTPAPATVAVRHGHMVRDGPAVHIPMVRALPATDEPRTVQVATTTDGGATWVIEDIHVGTDINHDWPSMAVTESGDRIVVVTAAGATSILGLHQPPNGTWSEPFLVHDATNSTVTWPSIDGGAGRHATFVVDGAAVNRTQHAWLGRIDLADRSIQQWDLGEGGVEFASVDHDAAGNAYAVWTLDDAQRFVRLDLVDESRDSATPPA